LMDGSMELIARILEIIKRFQDQNFSMIDRLITVVGDQQKELETQRTGIGRALLETREAKSTVTDWLAKQVKLELLEQDIRELKAVVSGLRTEIQQMKSRLPEEKDSD